MKTKTSIVHGHCGVLVDISVEMQNVQNRNATNGNNSTNYSCRRCYAAVRDVLIRSVCDAAREKTQQ